MSRDDSSLGGIEDRGTRKDLEDEYVRQAGRATGASVTLSSWISLARWRLAICESDFEGDGENMGQDAFFCITDVRDLAVGDKLGLVSVEMFCEVDAMASWLGNVADRLSIFALRGVELVDRELRDGERELREVFLFEWSEP